MYSKEVYTVVKRQRLSLSGPEQQEDDSTDGLMEIIAAGRSVKAAIHTGGSPLHTTAGNIDIRAAYRDGEDSHDAAAGKTGDEGAVVKETQGSLNFLFFFFFRSRWSFSPFCCSQMNWMIH